MRNLIPAIPFEPLIRNPHVLTILANYWPRGSGLARFAARETLYQTEPGVQVLAHVHEPPGPRRGEVLLLHGLEGSSSAGYLRSMAETALRAGYAVQRLNMRSCGGTESLCATMYHAGLTSDLRAILGQLEAERRTPVFLVGYSLGGNIVLKLAGELGDDAKSRIAGVCAVSTPIDLAACVERMRSRENRLYDWQFVRRMRGRIRKRGDNHGCDLDRIRNVYDFDEAITAPSFGFGNAAQYYATQSSVRFVPGIRVPTLLIAAKDDPMVPFGMFERDEVRSNPCVAVLPVSHGGHLGFLSRRRPRFWLDRVLLGWMDGVQSKHAR